MSGSKKSVPTSNHAAEPSRDDARSHAEDEIGGSTGSAGGPYKPARSAGRAETGGFKSLAADHFFLHRVEPAQTFDDEPDEDELAEPPPPIRSVAEAEAADISAEMFARMGLDLARDDFPDIDGIMPYVSTLHH